MTTFGIELARGRGSLGGGLRIASDFAEFEPDFIGRFFLPFSPEMHVLWDTVHSPSRCRIIVCMAAARIGQLMICCN